MLIVLTSGTILATAITLFFYYLARLDMTLVSDAMGITVEVRRL